MIKKIKKSAIILSTFIICALIVFWPKDIFKLTGKDLSIKQPVYLTIRHKYSIIDGGTLVESDNVAKINTLIQFFKRYKCIRVPIYNYKDFDNKEMYAISIRTDDTLLQICTTEDEHIFLTSKYGFYGPYKVIGKKLDLKFIEEFCRSIK